jgi:hypothetical protein
MRLRPGSTLSPSLSTGILEHPDVAVHRYGVLGAEGAVALLTAGAIPRIGAVSHSAMSTAIGTRSLRFMGGAVDGEAPHHNAPRSRAKGPRSDDRDACAQSLPLPNTRPDCAISCAECRGSVTRETRPGRGLPLTARGGDPVVHLWAEGRLTFQRLTRHAPTRASQQVALHTSLNDAQRHRWNVCFWSRRPQRGRRHGTRTR